MKKIKYQFRTIDKLDFRDNRSQLIWSYVYRIIALFIFSGVFHYYVNFLHGTTSFQSLVNIDISGVSSFVSILLLMIDLIFILYLHEMIHAGVYYITKKQRPEIGFRGLVIYAAAPTQVNSRKEIVMNALAPFTIISIIGLGAVIFLPTMIIPWVFIPTLVNAAASGGDFMTIYFVLKQNQSTYFNDVGDIIYALQPKK